MTKPENRSDTYNFSYFPKKKLNYIIFPYYLSYATYIISVAIIFLCENVKTKFLKILRFTNVGSGWVVSGCFGVVLGCFGLPWVVSG